MKTLLIVDDQELYLQSLKMALQSRYDVRTALDYETALQALKQPVDIALLDIRLDEDDESNADGLKLLEWIREHQPDTAAFVMSAYQEFHYAENALNLGALHFFRKPIDVTNLINILHEKA